MGAELTRGRPLLEVQAHAQGSDQGVDAALGAGISALDLLEAYGSALEIAVGFVRERRLKQRSLRERPLRIMLEDAIERERGALELTLT
jgi:hypothetical protein